MSEARNHHYVPQCYLKGFADGRSKKSKLTVFSYEKRCRFVSNPRNVCAERDYNRINVEGQDPNLIEKKYSKIESGISKSLQSVASSGSIVEEDKNNILYLMAMMAARSPSRREHWRKFEEKVVKQVMQMNVQTEGRWKSLIAQANLVDEVGYEAAQRFVENDQFSIETSNEHKIDVEMKTTDTIYENLIERSWKTIRATKDTGPFITSDLPVNLIWEDVENNPELLYKSPGFGVMGTVVVFTVSKDIAYIGQFEEEDSVGESDPLSVANINTIIMRNFDRFFFSNSNNFNYLSGGSAIVNSNTAFEAIDAMRGG